MRRAVRRGVTWRLWHEGTPCSPLARLISINILKGRHRSKCVLVVLRAGSCGALYVVVWHGASGAREPLARLIFINILKGGHRSKCVLVVRRAGSCGACASSVAEPELLWSLGKLSLSV